MDNTISSPIILPSKLLAVVADDSDYHLKPAVFVAEAAGAVKRVELESGQVTRTFRPDTSTPVPLNCLALGQVIAMSQGGQTLARTLYAGSSDKCIYSWNLLLDCEGRICYFDKGTTFIGHTDFVQTVLCVRLGTQQILMSASADATIIIWNASTGEKLHLLKSRSGGVQALAIDLLFATPSGVTLFSGDSNGEIRGWNISSTWAQEISTDAETQPSPEGRVTPLIAHETSICALKFEKDQDSEFDLWTASADKMVKRFSRLNNWTTNTVLQHEDFIRDIVLDEQGGKVITACCDGKVRVWDKVSGSLVHTFVGHDEEVTGLAMVQANGWRGVVSVSIDGTIRRWSLGQEDLKKAIDGAAKPVHM